MKKTFFFWSRLCLCTAPPNDSFGVVVVGIGTWREGVCLSQQERTLLDTDWESYKLH